MHVGVVRGDHQEDHEDGEDAGDADGQQFAHGETASHLGMDRFELLGEFRISLGQSLFRHPLIVVCGLVRGGLHGLVLRQVVAWLRAFDLLCHIVTDGPVFGSARHVGEGFLCQLTVDGVSTDPAGLELWIVHICVDRHRDHDHHHAGESAAPGSQKSAHFLFVGIAGRCGISLRPRPGHAVEERAEDASCNIEQVKIPQLTDVIGIDETLARRPVQQYGEHVLVPGKLVEEENDQNGIQRIGNDALYTVADHNGDLTAEAGDHGRRADTEKQQKSEGGKLPAENIQVDGQIQIVEKEAGSDSGKDRVVQNARKRLNASCRDPEGTIVPKLEELPHCHGPRLAEAIGAESGQTEEQSQRHGQLRPELKTESAGIIHFQHGNDADQAHTGFATGHGDHVSSGHPAGRQKVRHAPNVFAGKEADPDHDDEGNEDDNVIDPVHDFLP